MKRESCINWQKKGCKLGKSCAPLCAKYDRTRRDLDAYKNPKVEKCAHLRVIKDIEDTTMHYCAANPYVLFLPFGCKKKCKRRQGIVK